MCQSVITLAYSCRVTSYAAHLDMDVSVKTCGTSRHACMLAGKRCFCFGHVKGSSPEVCHLHLVTQYSVCCSAHLCVHALDESVCNRVTRRRLHRQVHAMQHCTRSRCSLSCQTSLTWVAASAIEMHMHMHAADILDAVFVLLPIGIASLCSK